MVCVVSAYNTTQDIFRSIEQVCTRHKKFKCRYENEILVVDWNYDMEKNVVWNFNEHARELITGELALHMIHQLPALNPLKRITMIPILNVWGRTKAMGSAPCQRKNKHGIDTNRNFWTPTNHHKYRKSSEEYEGAVAISEPESKLLKKVLNGAKRYVNVHSGEFSIYMPYDGSYKQVDNYKTMREAIHKYAVHCPQCTVGPAAVKSFSRAFGPSVD